MKKLTAILLALSFLGACSLSRIDRYPGKPLTSFPENIRGEYRLSMGGIRAIFKSNQMDSVRMRISKDKVESLNEKGAWQTEFEIGKDEVLSQHDQYLFLSRRDVNLPKFWATSLISLEKNEIIVHPISASDKSLVKDRLKNYLPLKLMIKKGKESKTITIENKNTAMLNAMTNLPADAKDSVLYYQMNEELLVKFITKELNDRNGLKFVKIKEERNEQ